MKNNIYISILLAFTCSIVMAQKSGVCVYKVYPIESALRLNKDDKDVNKKSKQLLLKAINYGKRFDYVLKFNSKEAISYIDESLAVGNDEYYYVHMIAKAVIGEGVYYQNKLDKLVLWETDIMGSNLLVHDTLGVGWKITNQTKNIGKYKVVKAIKDCETCNKFDEVWFAPSINVPFGPREFCGLPGLVLEVKRKSHIFKLESITFKDKEIEIQKPTKGRKITAQEYHELTNRAREQARN